VKSRGAKYWNTGAIPLVAPDLLGDIISTASDIAIVVSGEGSVLSVLINPNHRSFGQLEHWDGKDLREFLTVESVPKLDTQLTQFAEDEGTSRAIELNHSDGTTWEFPVRYTFHRIGPDGALLMLGRDLRPVAEMQQQLVKAQVALERDYEAQREYDTRYRVVMEAAREALVFVSVGSGRILDMNKSAAALLGGQRDDLIGGPLAQEFEGRRRGELLETLSNTAITDSGRPLTMEIKRTRQRVQVTPTVFRAAGERMLLCRIEPVDQKDLAADAMSENLLALFQDGVDAMVFTDKDGVILTANDSFLNLADVAHRSLVKGKSFADFMARGSVDLKVLLENAARSGQMRMYATKLASEYGSEISVEVSATYLSNKTYPSFGFIIRDASRAEAVRKPGVAVSDDAMQSVMELVGSATLKHIVAETTDVVEKMCIETAVELTRNNRVAAAEMLGLSRQSLYVKLRKYGLLARDGED
jgi:transcriptional regulator PpsR